jgi:hypothetical protein
MVGPCDCSAGRTTITPRADRWDPPPRSSDTEGSRELREGPPRVPMPLRPPPPRRDASPGAEEGRPRRRISAALHSFVSPPRASPRRLLLQLPKLVLAVVAPSPAEESRRGRHTPAPARPRAGGPRATSPTHRTSPLLPPSLSWSSRVSRGKR